MTPDSWRTVRLADLAAAGPDTFVDGDWIESKDQDDTGSIRLLQVGNVLRGALKTTGNLRWVNDATAKRLKCTLLVEGDILIARMPDPIGRACLVPSLPYPAITAVDCAILRVDSDTVDARFAVHYFNSQQHLSSVLSQVTGSTRQRVSRGNLAALPVLLPPVGEQRKIAAILSSVDDAIEATQAVIEQLQVVKKAMMAELLTRGLPGRHTRFKQTELGEIPDDWEVCPLHAVSRVVTGATPSTNEAAMWGNGFPFVTPGDIGDDREVQSAARSVTTEGLTKSREVPPRAILVTCIGSTIGKIAMASGRCCTNQQINSVICSDALLPEFGYFALVLAKPRILARASSTAVPIINKGLFEQLIVPVPPRAEQEAIASALTSVENSRAAHVNELRALSLLKVALMSVLLTGQVRVRPDEEAA